MISLVTISNLESEVCIQKCSEESTEEQTKSIVVPMRDWLLLCTEKH